jgi:hypothetical protein
VTKNAYNHHEIFSQFRRWCGSVPAGFEADFLGVKYRTAYFTVMPPQPNDRFEAHHYPAFNNEYFEWIDLLESVAWAKTSRPSGLVPKSHFNEKLTIHLGGSERYLPSGRRFGRSSCERKHS